MFIYFEWVTERQRNDVGLAIDTIKCSAYLNKVLLYKLELEQNALTSVAFVSIHWKISYTLNIQILYIK